MRISQLKALFWLGNLAVLAATGWATMRFLEAHKVREGSKAAKAPEWPDDAEGEENVTPRWPGPISEFDHIFKTPVDGKVPPPPEIVKEPEKPKFTKAQLFRRSTSMEGGGIIYVDSPVDSVVEIKANSGTGFMRTGETVDGWQLIDIRLVEKAEFVRRVAVATFACLDADVDELIEIEETEPQQRGLLEPGKGPIAFKPTMPGDVVYEQVAKDKIDGRQAYRSPTDPNHWTIPADEALWWRDWGRSQVLDKLSLAAKVNQVGNSVGVEVRSDPGVGTPVSSGRGIVKGDVVKSINGTPIRSPEDLSAYLRDAKGVDRFEVEVEDGTGKTRTMVYVFSRR